MPYIDGRPLRYDPKLDMYVDDSTLELTTDPEPDERGPE